MRHNILRGASPQGIPGNADTIIFNQYNIGTNCCPASIIAKEYACILEYPPIKGRRIRRQAEMGRRRRQPLLCTVGK